MRWFGFGFNAFGQIYVHEKLIKEECSDPSKEVKAISPTELTLACHVDRPGCCQMRASWSRRASLHLNGDSCVCLSGFGAASESCGVSVKESRGCKDASISESHLTLTFPDRIESWDLLKEETTPSWSMEINAESSGHPLNLPLVPGGYIATKLPFYRSLSPHLKAKSLALGAEHAILLTASGAVYTWGLGSHGQLGHGGLTSEEEPRAVEALWGMSMSYVATGGWHSVCISDGGDLYVWGWNESGQLGLPSRGLRKTLQEQHSQQAGAPCQDGSISPGEESQEGEKHEEVFISIQAFPALLDITPSCEIRTVSCGSRHTAAVTTSDCTCHFRSFLGFSRNTDPVLIFSSDSEEVESSLHQVRHLVGQFATFVRESCPPSSAEVPYIYKVALDRSSSLILRDIPDPTMPLQFVYTNQDFVTDVHRSPGNNLGTALPPVKFDTTIRAGWTDRMDRGLFRYHLGDLQTRILPGTHGYVAQLNIQRGTERRKPQEILSIQQEFSAKQFNFNKINPEEIICEMIKVTEGGNKNRKLHQPSRMVVVVNVSPLEFGHCLFVPDPSQCFPQVLTSFAIQGGIESVLLSSDPGFRVGFNSLGAFASVNHLHLHGYYLDHELKIESTPVKPLVPEKGFYHLLDFPGGFLFYTESECVEKAARAVCRVTDFLVQGNIAHNLFLTRGCPPCDRIQTEEDRRSRKGVRVIVWPRKSCFGAKEESAFNVALCELAGHLPFKNKEDFEATTERNVMDIIQRYLLPDAEFHTLEEQLTHHLMDL